MKYLAVLLMGCSVAAVGQVGDWIAVPPVDPSAPKNVHEYAMRVIEKVYEHRTKPHKWGGFTAVPDAPETFRLNVSTFSFASGAKQSFSIDKDGKILLENMTIEDALLSMAAMQAEDTLRQEEEWGRKEEKREEETSHNPPPRMKAGAKTYKVRPAAQLPDTVLAVTNCSQEKIDYLIDQGTKRNSVLHEMMHVATNCDLSPSLHRSIYEMSGPLLKLMQDNPQMMDYLLKGVGVNK